MLLKSTFKSKRFAEVNVCGNSSKIYTAVVPADVETLCRTSFLTPNHRIRLLCGHYHQTRVIIITVRTAETLCQLIIPTVVGPFFNAHLKIFFFIFIQSS